MGYSEKLYLLVLIMKISKMQASDRTCCEQKLIKTEQGNDVYNFIRTNDETSEFDCKDNCVYEKQGEADSRYCFKDGGDQVPECNKSEMPRIYDCNRNCSGATPSICVFSLTLESLFSDGDGYRADGRNRSILGFRRTDPEHKSLTMPGPPIVICEGDTVELNYHNNISPHMTNIDGSTDVTTLHFHGIRELTRPWSDGVPYVSQCPLNPGDTFCYGFNSAIDGAPAGNYWYHSHVGNQRTNGAYGALIIKEKMPIKNPLGSDDVIDDAKNTLLIQEWYESSFNQTPVSILINGQGRVAEKKLSGSDEEISNHLHGTGGSFSYIPNSEFEGANFSTSYNTFYVNWPGFVYRFRIISAISQNFPLRLSIDDHRFTAIAADSRKIEPLHNLTDLWIAAAERFDILVQTKNVTWQDGGLPFKIRLFGHSDPSTYKQDQVGPSLCTIAWLQYPNQNPEPNYVTPYDCAGFKELPSSPRTLNPLPTPQKFKQRLKYPVWRDDTAKQGDIFVADLRDMGQQEDIKNIEKKSGETMYYEFFGDLAFNRQKMTFPNVPFLLQDPQKNDDRCSENPQAQECQNVIELPWKGDRSEWAEIVLINNGEIAAHPIHQHGGWYWVVGMGSYDFPINETYIIEQDKDGKIPRNFTAPPAKDTLQIPLQGYAILRIPLDNAGAWIFHCHINFHVVSGMATVEQIGHFKDWSIGPLTKNENCTVPPVSPDGDKKGINWYLYMAPATRCVKPGVAVTFHFFGHSINVLSYEDWNSCDLSKNQVFPHNGQPVDTTASDGPYEFKTDIPGAYFIACGLGEGYHCKNGMKATIIVGDSCTS